MPPAPATVDAYIAGFPPEVAERLEAVRRAVREAAPDAAEAIRYGLPTFVQDGNVVHFGAFRGHIGFYPTPSGIEAFTKELAAYQQGKGSVQFPFERPLPLDLIGRIVRFRVEQNRRRAAGRRRKR